MESCAYCGEASTCFDHVIPVSYISACSSKKRTGKEPGFKIPSCFQCNGILGDRVFPNLVARKAYLHARLRVKLAKWTQSVMWDEEELSELGPVLRSTVEISQARTAIARDRVKYASAPPEARWLAIEERWRAKNGDDTIPDSAVRENGPKITAI